MISFKPTEEQQMIVTLVKQFANDEMRKIYRECDENDEIPARIVETAWSMGLVSSAIPEKYGGPGGELSAITGALLAEELAWGDLAMAMNIMAPSLVIIPLITLGTEEQKQKYLPEFCGDKFRAASAALIEPNFEFDPGALKTTATVKAGSYVLKGQKCLVPLAADANPLIVYAAEKGKTCGFIVDQGVDGLEVGEREKNMGIKALNTYELNLKNCQVPEANKLGGAKGNGFNLIMNRSRVALAALAVGVARAAYEYSRDYAKDRTAFGEPIASRQAIAFMLAEMAIEVDATRLITWEAAWTVDKGNEATKEASLVKSYADDMVLMVTDRAVQILGGHGYIREHPVELWLRNGRGFATFDGMAIV